MKVCLDDERIIITDAENTEQLLEEVRKLLDGKIIKTIYLNGSKVIEDDLLKEDDLSKISTLNFETKEVDDLIEETLKKSNDYLPRLKKGIIDSAELFSCGEIEEAVSKYQLCIQGIEWYTNIVQKVSFLINDEALTKKNIAMINSINDKLQELVEAFENQDFILIADILEYEIVEFIEGFIELNDELYKIALD